MVIEELGVKAGSSPANHDGRDRRLPGDCDPLAVGRLNDKQSPHCPAVFCEPEGDFVCAIGHIELIALRSLARCLIKRIIVGSENRVVGQLRLSTDVSPIGFPVNMIAIDVVVFTAGVHREKCSLFEHDRRRILECPGTRDDAILPCR